MTLTHTLLSLLAGAGTLATFGCSSVATDDGATSEDKLVTVPEGAEIESVSCGPAKAIDRLKLPPGLAAEDIENGTLAHNFVMKRVGTVDGQPYYAMDDFTVVHEYTHYLEEQLSSFYGIASWHDGCQALLVRIDSRWLFAATRPWIPESERAPAFFQQQAAKKPAGKPAVR